jgi:hypothetical protein
MVFRIKRGVDEGADQLWARTSKPHRRTAAIPWCQVTVLGGAERGPFLHAHDVAKDQKAWTSSAKAE